MAVYADTECIHCGNDIDEVLVSAGTPIQVLNSMDSDIKEYIAECLSEEIERGDPIEYIPIYLGESAGNRSEQILTGISFSVAAYISNNVIHIFPTYEFTTPKKPVGADAFSYILGDAFQTFEYGGRTWYKVYASDPWTMDDAMVANQQGLNYACYSGNQLGTPSSNIYIKGCAYCKAYVGNGSDNRIVMQYLYNPGGGSWSLGISYRFLSISFSFNSDSTRYVGSATYYVTY